MTTKHRFLGARRKYSTAQAIRRTRSRKLVIESLESRRLLAAGMLDASFGNGGKVLSDLDIGLADDVAYDVAYQSDGKFIVVGATLTGESDFAVARYNSDGSLDESFDSDGIVTIDFGGSYDRATSVAIDNMGRIVVAGVSNQVATGDHFAIARLIPAGALDVGFSGDGKQIVDLDGLRDVGYDVAVDSANRVIVAGDSDYGTAILRLQGDDGELDPSFGNGGKKLVEFGGGQTVEVDSADRVLVAGGASQGLSVMRLRNDNGELDSSFGVDGKQMVDVGGSVDARSMTMDSLGRILVAGSASLPSGQEFAVVRLTPNGQLDVDFSGDGKQTIHVGFGTSNSLGQVGGVAVDSLDRVLVSGSSDDYVEGTRFSVVRLTADGSLDNTFGAAGKQHVFSYPSSDGTGYAVAAAVDGSDRVLLVGTPILASQDFHIARLTSTGVLDTTFSYDGVVITNVGTTAGGVSSDSARGIAVDQSNGKYVVVGQDGATGKGTAVRYKRDGSLDRSFGEGGVATIDDMILTSVAVDESGRALVAGYSYQTAVGYENPVARFTVARLRSNGELDPSFGNQGKQIIDFGSDDEQSYSVAVDSAGRVLLAGYIYNAATGGDFAVARLTTSGVLDTAFDTDGKQTVDFGSFDDYGYGLALDSLGRILVTGFTLQESTGGDFAVARLTTNGTLDTAFATDGKQTFDFGSFDDYGSSVAVDSFDRVLVTGFAYQNGFAVARLTATGELDHSFDSDGKQTIDFGNSIYEVSKFVAVDSFDRVLLGGYSFDTGFSDFALARLTVGGTLDLTFDSDGIQVVDFGSNSDIPYGMVLGPDGKIVLAGQSSQSVTQSDIAMARLEGYGLSVVGTPGDDSLSIGGIALGEIFVAGLAGNDTITVTSAVQGGVILAGQGGSDSYFINFGSLGGQVRVLDGGAVGTDTLTAMGNPNDETFIKTVDPATGRRTIDRIFPTMEHIVADGIEEAVLDGGPGDDHITDPGERTVIRGGLGNDTILINGTFGSGVTTDGGQGSDNVIIVFGEIAGSVEVIDTGTGALDVNSLTIQSTTIDNTFSVTGSQVTWGENAEQSINYSSVAQLNVEPGIGTNTVQIDSTSMAAVTISSRGGSDSYLVQLGNLDAPITIENSASTGSISVAIVGTFSDDVLTLTGTEIQSASGEIIHLETSVNEVAIEGGAGDDQITVSEFTAEVPAITLDGGGGSNTFTLVNVGSSPVTSLAVTGGSGGGNNQVVVEGPLPPSVVLQQIAPQNVSIDPRVSEIVAPVGSIHTFSTASSFNDPDIGDAHTAVWKFTHVSASGNLVTDVRPGTITFQGAGIGTVSNSFSFGEAGVYTVTLTISDNHGGVTTSVERTFVVYDPSAGFVTGGGWINSPTGAYTANPALTGRATFGFHSKYQNGNSVPSGNTEFQFKVANFNFKSISYDWLVVSGAKARFRGVGTVNGVGGYGFELTAWDGQAPGGSGADKFRIKIWFANQGNGVVYDNMMGAVDGADPTTALGGGSIVIHKKNERMMASGGAAIGMSGNALSQETLNHVVEQAVNYWESTGIGAHAVSSLRQIQFEWADLSDAQLGIASDTNYVWIDRDAAGYGWQWDSTGTTDSSADNGMHLLSVVAHELGHKLGWEHSHHSDVMAPNLDVGVQTLGRGVVQPLAFIATGPVMPISFNLDITLVNTYETPRLPTQDDLAIEALDHFFADFASAPGMSRWLNPSVSPKSRFDSKLITVLEDGLVAGFKEHRLKRDLPGLICGQQNRES